MSHPLFDITGKTAPVTGSSRGIGLARARKDSWAWPDSACARTLSEHLTTLQ